MKSILFSLLFFGLSSCKSQDNLPLKKNPDDNSLLWRISGKGLSKPSYLFGTFHLLCKEDIHFSNPLQTSIQRSDVVYMEIKLDDPEMMSKSMSLMMMKKDSSINELLSDKDYSKLNKFMNDSLHVPLLMLNHLKPYFIMAMLYTQMIDCKSPSGVEEELMKLVKQKNKPIRGLETIEFQASVFDKIPYKLQAEELVQNIDSMQTSKVEFSEMVSKYKRQQLADLSALSLKSEGVTKQYDDLMLYDRNRKWVKFLVPLFIKQSMFIAVGAGHLSGKLGLINLLRAEGFTVEPLVNQ